VDLLPTFCELAGAKFPKGYRPDGLSQVKALQGKGQLLRSKPLFWKMQSSWPIQKARPYHWVSYAIVHQNWKLMTNRDSSYAELYDLATDPLEKNDLAQQKPAVVQGLLQQIADWKATLPAKPTGNVFSKERLELPKSRR